MTRMARILLPDGRQLDYEIRRSARGKSLRLKMTARDGLAVSAPDGLHEERIIELVAQKSDWIFTRLAQFDEVRHLLGTRSTLCPQAFDLPALAESWRVEYRQTKGKTARALTDRPGRIVVYGAADDQGRCNAALRRWLARRAKASLGHWLKSLSDETGIKFNRLTIKSQRTRWGSCSADSSISLNCKLLFLPRELVRYVLIHELCHTLERNHTTRFWTHLRQFAPETNSLHGRMRSAWKQIPTWAHPIQAEREGF
ncbi:MAG: SprT family zinc-dependent metalloprotease [Eubacteriales bacterium]|nr:SprT family zinc-dependent metalloprotease [Eubacteriales bacterium]